MGSQTKYSQLLGRHPDTDNLCKVTILSQKLTVQRLQSWPYNCLTVPQPGCRCSELCLFPPSALSLGSAGGQGQAELLPEVSLYSAFLVLGHGRSEWQRLNCPFRFQMLKIPAHQIDIKLVSVFLDVDPTLLNLSSSCMQVLCEGHGEQGTGKPDTSLCLDQNYSSIADRTNQCCPISFMKTLIRFLHYHDQSKSIIHGWRWALKLQ